MEPLKLHVVKVRENNSIAGGVVRILKDWGHPGASPEAAYVQWYIRGMATV